MCAESDGTFDFDNVVCDDPSGGAEETEASIGDGCGGNVKAVLIDAVSVHDVTKEPFDNFVNCDGGGGRPFKPRLRVRGLVCFAKGDRGEKVGDFHDGALFEKTNGDMLVTNCVEDVS